MRNPDRHTTFRFKQFEMNNALSAMKIGTDGVLLGAWCPFNEKGLRRVWDVGAGTGLIALMIAQRTPASVKITAIELDPVASQEARANVATSPWPDKIEVVTEDINHVYKALPRPQLIVSNPPFFTETLHAPDAARAMARHALTLNYAQLIKIAHESLKLDGKLAFIAPSALVSRIEEEVAFGGMYVERRVDIATRPGRPPKRTMWLVGLRPNEARKETLLLDSPEYHALVSPFYL
ncbi:MAG: methyltransferase [Bacteroidales bacterium]|nr:methyltransferase [Bacteroidales bacterium]